MVLPATPGGSPAARERQVNVPLTRNNDLPYGFFGARGFCLGGPEVGQVVLPATPGGSPAAREWQVNVPLTRNNDLPYGFLAPADSATDPSGTHALESVWKKGTLKGNSGCAGLPKQPKNRSVTVAALLMERLFNLLRPARPRQLED